MNELFKSEIREAENKLNKAGYYVYNMIYDPDEFEVYNANDVVMDHLSVAQLQQLADLLAV